MSPTLPAPEGPNLHPSLDEILKDFPPGPLDVYRNKASFSWKDMKLFIDGEDITLFKVSVIKMLYFALSSRGRENDEVVHVTWLFAFSSWKSVPWIRLMIINGTK